MKRLFDIFVSLNVLLFLLPFLIIVGLFVRCDTAGPVFFRQTRVGRDGRQFIIFKFRTMYHQPLNAGQEITIDYDARVTRAGHFLRHWKIDELPQLWNVLRGDMSIVGPRPEVPTYVELYPEQQRKIVLGIRPGLTDPASIKYRSEAKIMAGAQDPEKMYREVILPDKVSLYAEYAKNISFLTDVKIIIKTISTIIK